MKIAYFDPFSGASGDMILGALVDAGLSPTALSTELSKLPIGGYHLRADRAGQHGIHGTRVTVAVSDDVHSRTWGDIRQIIEGSPLDPPVRDTALRIFERLAIAEARIHATTPDDVHFHEVGGVDAIVDICGACIGLSLLGIEEVYAGPPQIGHGFANSAHGVIPVPAPATLELLAEARAPIAAPSPVMADTPAELLTPTGAAILTTLARFERPSYVPSAIGYGFGSKELPWPNALRVWIGELAAPEDAVGGEVLLETNIDDMNPQFVELVTERLFTAGALDVWLTPITMKKGRPATQISVLAPAGRRLELESTLIENTSTLGVRALPIERTKAARQSDSVTTRWGDVRIKVRIWNGRAIDITPEYDDVVAIARSHDIPIRTVWNEAYRIGETRIGQRR
ncbi:MAG TPA: nickel pincer cofactor biosynthesis protein LarC [Thermomicrobiales bacterium]|nr:nickel pincer cofactor biosynthesis protein LarC [Thermomicrobiales bacterium]